MENPPQLSANSLNYKGIDIRRTPEDGFVSLTDLWRSEGKSWAVRPDIWAKQEENAKFLSSVKTRSGSLDWKVFRGGTFQGTFASPEIAARYAESLSSECSDWLCDALSLTIGVAKARRETIYLGAIPLEVFRLITGDYRLSQTQVAEAVGKDESFVRKFLESGSPEALPYKGFTPGKVPIEGEKTRFNAIPIGLAIAFWTKEAAHNPVAIRILAAAAHEAIERRADRAFGIHRSENDYNRRFVAFDWLKIILPDYEQTAGPLVGADSMTLAEPELLRKLKRKYPKEIFSLKKSEFLDAITLLGSQTDDWKLTREKGLPYPEGAANRNAYPDLVSQPFECLVEGKIQKVALLLQGVDTIVDEIHIKDCVYPRAYIELVKEHLRVDHVLLFFVSPYGLTRYAAACIKEREDLRCCVGVVTVKQLASFLVERAVQNKGGSNLRIGKLRKQYSYLTGYKTLEEIVGLEESKKLAIESGTQPLQLTLFSLVA